MWSRGVMNYDPYIQRWATWDSGENGVSGGRGWMIGSMWMWLQGVMNYDPYMGALGRDEIVGNGGEMRNGVGDCGIADVVTRA